MKHMSSRFNLPPGVTVGMIEGDPEGFFMITDELLLMGDTRLIQLQSAPDGDFAANEHTIDLTPTQAQTLVTAILKMLNGDLATDGREVMPDETYKLVFGIDPPAQEGAKAAAIILGKVEPGGLVELLPGVKPPAPPVSREILEDMQNLKTAILELGPSGPDEQILYSLYLRLAESMKLYKPPRINSAPAARVYTSCPAPHYPEELVGFETGFIGEGEPAEDEMTVETTIILDGHPPELWAEAISGRILDQFSLLNQVDGGDAEEVQEALIQIFSKSPDLMAKLIGSPIIEEDYFDNLVG